MTKTYANRQIVLDEAVEAEAMLRCFCPATRSGRRLARRLADEGVLQPVFEGLYDRPKYWDSLNTRQRHLHVVRALAARFPQWTFCSYSAAVLYGLAASYHRLRDVSVMSGRTQSGRSIPGVVKHRYRVDSKCSFPGGIRCTSLMQTVLDCMVESSFVDSLIVADSLLRNYGLDRAEATRRLRALGHHRPGIRMALFATEHADARSENGGESMARALMIERGWEVPDLQVELEDPLEPGRIFRVDFLWKVGESIVLGELDGFVKTELAASDGRGVPRQQFDERQREARLSLYGYKMVRITMADLYHPDQLDQKLSAAGIPRC